MSLVQGYKLEVEHVDPIILAPVVEQPYGVYRVGVEADQKIAQFPDLKKVV